MATLQGSPDALSRSDKRWNFLACLTDAVGWPLGAAFVSTTTILPLFLGHLGAGNLTIGALPALYNLFVFAPGLWLAGYISRLRRARGYLFGIALLERFALVPLGALTLLWGRSHPDRLIGVTFLCIGFHSLMMGLNQPAYWAVVGKCVPAHWRGRLFGYAGGIGGVLGLGVERLLHRLLAGPHGGFPDGYSAAFLIGFAIMTISVLPLGAVREPISVPSEDPHAGHYWHDSVSVWRGNPAFRRFLRAQIAVTASSLATPFFVLRAVHLHAAAAVPGYTATLVLVGAFGGLGWGAWSDRAGNRQVLLASSLCLAFAPALAAVAISAVLYYGVFALYALGMAGVVLAGNNIVMEYAGQTRDIPLYTALYNVVTALPRTAAPLIGGLLADQVGYPPLFWLSALLALVSLALTLQAGEPRQEATLI